MLGMTILMKKIALILVHYNNDKDTNECLDSLARLKTKHQLEIVVVDNNSQTEFKPKKSQLCVHSLKSATNLGFTGGNNLGMQYALKNIKPDYFLLLNTDTLVEPNFMDELVKFAERQSRVGIVSPKIYFAKGYEYHQNSYDQKDKGNVLWFAGGSIDWDNMYAFHRAIDEVDRGQTDLPRPKRSKHEIPYYGYQTMDFASGCCMLIPTSVIKKVGMFDESYFMYWEDVDLSLQISRAGYQLYYCPDAVIWHKNAGSTGGAGSAFHVKMQEKNRLRFAVKYAPWKTKVLVLRDYFTKLNAS